MNLLASLSDGHSTQSFCILTPYKLLLLALHPFPISRQAEDRNSSFVILVGSDRPDAPPAPQVTLEQTYASLSWKPPNHHNSALLFYEVHAIGESGTHTSHNHAATANSTFESYRFVGLLPWTQYRFVLRVNNSIGWSGLGPATELEYTKPLGETDLCIGGTGVVASCFAESISHNSNPCRPMLHHV